MGADSSPWPGISDYSATKAAVAAYTRGWARDLGPKGHHRERGAARSDRHRHESRGRQISPPRRRRARRSGRYGRPEEVGATVAFLASKNAGVHHRREHRGGWRLQRLTRCKTGRPRGCSTCASTHRRFSKRLRERRARPDFIRRELREPRFRRRSHQARTAGRRRRRLRA